MYQSFGGMENNGHIGQVQCIIPFTYKEELIEDESESDSENNQNSTTTTTTTSAAATATATAMSATLEPIIYHYQMIQLQLIDRHLLQATTIPLLPLLPLIHILHIS